MIDWGWGDGRVVGEVGFLRDEVGVLVLVSRGRISYRASILEDGIPGWSLPEHSRSG